MNALFAGVQGVWSRSSVVLSGVLVLGGLLSSACADSGGYDLVSICPDHGDGQYADVVIDEQTVHQALGTPGNYMLYHYLKAPEDASPKTGTLYLEFTYLDVGKAHFSVEYNASQEDYRKSYNGYGRELNDSGQMRTGVFELADADLREAQNHGADLRITTLDPAVQLQICGARICTSPPPLYVERGNKWWIEPFVPRWDTERGAIDSSWLTGKVVCGYQGWFRCWGDVEERGWYHWSSNDSTIEPATLTFDMWPDMSEYSEEEKYPAPGFEHPGGHPAYLYSAADPGTIHRHFEWMKEYGIDGVEVQRFVIGLSEPAESSRVLGYALRAAARNGRVFYVGYDLTGPAPSGKTKHELITEDWKWLVDKMKVTSCPRYLHHNGRPVVCVFGFFPNDPVRYVAAAEADQIIDFFKNEQANLPPAEKQDLAKYSATLIGGVPWYWGDVADAAWSNIYKRFDVLKPWNVGNTHYDANSGQHYAATARWAEDIQHIEDQQPGQLYYPVVYPGFSWHNLTQTGGGVPGSPIARLQGEFYEKQFQEAHALGLNMAFVAMFDEVDEGTAIFKVAQDPPQVFQTGSGSTTPVFFVPYDVAPDHYLKLTGKWTKILRGKRGPFPP